MEKITPVLLCGGSGTRLWPISRKSNPKQFVPILDKDSLFQKTVKRLHSTENIDFNRPITITNSDFRFIVVEQFKDISTKLGPIFLEPSPKNTGPAILMAAIHLFKKNKNSIMLMTPTDHLIPETKKFHKLILDGMKQIDNGNLIIFGIKPTRPETGYGYIEIRKTFQKNTNIKKFVEKPNLLTAKKMIKKSNFYWNAGILLCRVKDLINAFITHQPTIYKHILNSLVLGKNDLDFFRLDKVSWSKCKNISIDYAILEKVKNVIAIPYNGNWSDMGDWNSVWEEVKKDKHGMAIKGNVTYHDCKNTLLRTENDGPELVGIGLENLISVAMNDAVLIANKNNSQDLKIMVEKLKKKKLSVSESFPKDYRPWGWFEVLSSSQFYKVKKIFVNPKASLSLQSHKFRSEHWIVVEGIAKVTIDKKVKTLKKGESTFIPVGDIHRLGNPGTNDLVIIEIQTGTYFGEDDIVRYEDNYGRNK